MTALATQLATVFGIGRSPLAPGTLASLAALPFAWAISFYAGPLVLAAAALVAFAAGVWASGHFSRAVGDDDPGACVIDELAGQWLACALSPLSLTGYALAFLWFRAFDITKLWPVSSAEKLPGGLGIMADDIVAGLIAGGIVAIFANAGLI
jgi:phosphatidylglycerophosphatase A